MRKTWTTPLWPQSDGMVEWFNNTLAWQLAKCCFKGQQDWDIRMLVMLMAYWSEVHKATN